MKAYVTIASGDIHGPEGSFTEKNQYLVDSNQDDVLDTFYLIAKLATHVDPVIVSNKVEMFLDLIVKDAVSGVVTSKNDAIKNGQPWSENDSDLELVIGIDSDDDSVDVELVNSGMIQHKRIEDIMNVIIGHYGYFD
jgi:hypothetical protein